MGSSGRACSSTAYTIVALTISKDAEVDGYDDGDSHRNANNYKVETCQRQLRSLLWKEETRRRGDILEEFQTRRIIDLTKKAATGVSTVARTSPQVPFITMMMVDG